MKLLILLVIAAAPILAVTDKITGPDGGWDYASVDTSHNRLLVARTDGVMAVDLATQAVTAQFVPGAGVHAAFVIPGSAIGVSTNGRTNSATLFDAHTGNVRAEVATGPKPDAATYDPATRTIWVMNGGDGTATVIDPATATVVGTVAVGGKLEFAVVDGRGKLFVNVEDKSEIAVIDTASRKVLRRIALPGCVEPSGLALIDSGVLIAACDNGVAKTVDAVSGKPGADIAIGAHPDAVIYDTARRRAYIPAGGDGKLTVIDTAGDRPRAIANVVTQPSARTGAVDPATGRVYLPAADYGPVPGARPKQVPGTFKILVVGN